MSFNLSNVKSEIFKIVSLHKLKLFIIIIFFLFINGCSLPSSVLTNTNINNQYRFIDYYNLTRDLAIKMGSQELLMVYIEVNLKNQVSLQGQALKEATNRLYTLIIEDYTQLLIQNAVTAQTLQQLISVFDTEIGQKLAYVLAADYPYYNNFKIAILEDTLNLSETKIPITAVEKLFSIIEFKRTEDFQIKRILRENSEDMSQRRLSISYHNVHRANALELERQGLSANDIQKLISDLDKPHFRKVFMLLTGEGSFQNFVDAHIRNNFKSQ